jgi:hypothetical protein
MLRFGAMRFRVLLVVFLLGGACKKETPPASTAAAAPGGKEKGARGDKPAMQPGAPISLAAVVDGKSVTWTRADFGKVKTVSVAGDQGDEQRLAWSLRDVVTTLVDAKARAVELTGEGSGKMAIDGARWKDLSKQPVLRQNRRGILKFYWVDESGKPLEEDGLRGVREIKISH